MREADIPGTLAVWMVRALLVLLWSPALLLLWARGDKPGLALLSVVLLLALAACRPADAR